MCGAHHNLARAAGASALMCVSAQGVMAQNGNGADLGPQIVGEQNGKLVPVDLQSIDFGFEMFYQFRRNNIEDTTTGSRTDTEHLFRETLTATSHMFLGHRNLADLTFSINFGIEDRFRDSPIAASDGHDSEVLLLFNARAEILGESATPVTVWGTRDQTLLEREFASSVESTTTEAGVSVRTFLETAPTTLRYFHREQERDDLGGQIDSSRIQDTLGVNTSWSPTDRQRVSLDYSLDFIDESQAAGVVDTFERHDGMLIHTLQLGSDRRNSLRSSVRLFDQSGNFQNQTIRFDEILRLQHTEDLDSRWTALYETRDIAGQEQEQARGNVLVRHRLFESLVTNITGGVGHYQLPDSDFTRDDYFGGVEFVYNKNVPNGRVNALLEQRFDSIDNSQRGSITEFRNTVHTFVDPFPVTLDQRFIIPTSILIRDNLGVQVFVEGIDYIVDSFPDRVEIRRQVGGSILDGQTVLIDYQQGPEPANTTETSTTAVSLRYNITEGLLRGLALYYIYRNIDQSIDAPLGSMIIANDVRNTRFGAEYVIGDFTFIAEQEEQDSDILPLERTRYSARYNRRVGSRSWVYVDTSHEEIDYTDSGNHIDLNRIVGEIGRRVDQRMNFRFRLNYRDQDDSFSGSTSGFEQTMVLDWSYRQTSMSISFVNALLESDNVDSDSQTVSVRFNRRF